jgi:hypothetical protein
MATKRRITIEASNADVRRSRSTLSLSDTSEAQRFLWEMAEEDDAHAAFTRWADHVRNRPSAVDRRKRNLLYASLYSNLPLLGFGVNSYTRNIPNQGRIALNATQNAIDSLTSKICKNRPRPMFTTVEGDYELREKAENADKYIDGFMYNSGYYETIYPGKVLDACIYGLGVTKTHAVDGECVIERTFPWELIIDDRETMYGDPVRIGQRKWYDKQVAFDLWRREGNGKTDKQWNRELEDAIDTRATEVDGDDFDRDESSEQVCIYQGWRTKTSKRDGKTITCLRGKTLEFAPFNDPLPFEFLRLEVQSMGFYGIGICERVSTIQSEINRLVRDIQMAMHLMAKPHWMVETSSNVNTASLNNDIATIIKYSGSVPPTVYTPTSMSGEVFQHLQYLVRTLYEITGISQLSAQSQKPAGLSSAVALRTYLNVETERFSNFLRKAEASASGDAMKAARVFGGMGRGKVKDILSSPSGRGRDAELVTWGKLDFDKVNVQIYPTSKLPDTPAGRREYALEMAQYTKVTTDDIFEMLEWTDTEAFAKERLAGKKNVRRDIAKMRRGDNVKRDAIGDHLMAYSMMLDAYEEAKHDGLPPKRLNVMREYIKACYRYLTGKVWSAAGPNPLPGQGPAPGAPPDPSMATAPPMNAPGALLPPGAPPPAMAPMPNGGVPTQ